MKKYLLVIIVLTPFIALAQDKGKKVKCMVTDATTAKSVKGVFAMPYSSDDTVHANAAGVFTLVVAGPEQVIVCAPGYEEAKILVAPDTKCSVALKPDEQGEGNMQDDEDEGDE